jgi:flagellar protein FlgJ
MLGAESIASTTAYSVPLAAKSGATFQKPNPARLKEMASEMEATFLSMLLKEMRETLEPDGGGLFPGDSGDVQGGLFDLYLGRHIAESGGVGLASSLLRQMREAEAAKTPTSTHAQQTPQPASGIASPLPRG